MKIIIASDHAGFTLKSKILNNLHKFSFNITDIGAFSKTPIDYPDIAQKLSINIISNKFDKGIMICGSGIGASIACNKFKNIRAGICHDTFSAHQGVEHNNMNILVMGEGIIGISLAIDIFHTFINSKFMHQSKYIRRLNKIKKIEQIQSY